MSPQTNTRVLLASYPSGLPISENFRVEQSPIGELLEGEVLLATRFVSVDAHMRAHDPTAKSAASPLHVGCVIEADGTAEVLESMHAEFRPGDVVLGRTGWQTHVRVPGNAVRHFPQDSMEEASGLVQLGTAALTAYTGLRDTAKAQESETLVVPAATGPIGAAAGQHGRMLGLWTIGIVSSQEEVAFAQQKLGFHAVLDRTSGDFIEMLRDACSEGIDVFFENLGGALFREVRPLMNDGGRIILTGTWTQYSHPLGGAGEYGSTATMEAVIRKKLALGVPKIEDASFSSFVEHVHRAVRNGSLWSSVRVEAGLQNAVPAWLAAIDSPDRETTVIRL